MEQKQTRPRDRFQERLQEIGVTNTEIINEDPQKLYVFAEERGYGITRDCYVGLDARLIESIGMDSLGENHHLYRPYAHHVLIFHIS